MAKSSGRGPTVEPLPAISHLLSAKGTVPESLAGKDITKPRDLYTFLSLGYLPINPLQWPNGTAPGINVDDKRVQFSLSTITTSSKQWDDHQSQNSYFHFDAHNPITGFPILPAITRTTSASCGEGEYDDDDSDRNPFEEDPILLDNGPRQSIINEEDHKIKISTTYIFAPTERLHEAVKYNRNVALPKIKPKRNAPGHASQPAAPAVNPKASHTSSKTVPVATASDLSPKNPDMYSSNSLFGMRPECIFMNNQLGERNPLLRQSKESPSQLVPKASPGLNDLKDYDEYPDVYWKLRDGTIGHPEDLEADMIDRDLYRLRQISSLKLNTIERTFQVAQDPFRKWRGKAGEPIFSPRQQQRPCNRIRKERMRQTDIPAYPQHVKLVPSMNHFPLKALNVNGNKKNEDSPLTSSRAEESFRASHREAVANGHELEIALHEINDEAHHDSTTATPREMVAASLDTFRRLEEEKEEQLNAEDVSIEKMHQMKGRKEKRTIKTSLVHVDLDSMDTYKREHRAAPKRPEVQIVRSLNNSINRESFGQVTNLNSSRLSPKVDKMDTARSLNEKVLHENRVRNSLNEEPDKGSGNNRNGPDTTTGKQPIKAPVATIMFQPQNERNFDLDNALTYLYNIHSGPGDTSPIISDASTVGKDRHKGANTPLKPVHLEVFSERRDPRSPIKIPTGRTTYHPRLPTYRLDLINYPPSNARQSCGLRSNSAGYLDGRQTTRFTGSTTQASRQRLDSSETRAGHSQAVGPPRSGDNSGVNIRFGRQGKIIVTSSREGRRSR